MIRPMILAKWTRMTKLDPKMTYVCFFLSCLHLLRLTHASLRNLNLTWTSSPRDVAHRKDVARHSRPTSNLRTVHSSNRVVPIILHPILFLLFDTQMGDLFAILVWGAFVCFLNVQSSIQLAESFLVYGVFIRTLVRIKSLINIRITHQKHLHFVRTM